MISGERADPVRRGFQAWIDGDEAGMLEVISPDVQVYGPPELVNPGEFNGHEGFMRWLNDWTDAWERITYEIKDAIDVGASHVVVMINQQATGRDGIEVTMDVAFLFEVKDRLCTYVSLFLHADDALAAAHKREAG